MKKSKKKRKILKIILIILAIFFAMIVIHYILNSSDKIYLARLGVNAEYVQEGEEVKGFFVPDTIRYREYRDIDNGFTFRLYRRNQMIMKKCITDTDYYFYKCKNEMYHQLDDIAKECLDNEYYIVSESGEPSLWKKKDVQNLEYYWLIVTWAERDYEKIAEDVFAKAEQKIGKNVLMEMCFFDSKDKYNNENYAECLKENYRLPNSDTISEMKIDLYDTVLYFYRNYNFHDRKKSWIYGVDKKEEETTEK